MRTSLIAAACLLMSLAAAPPAAAQWSVTPSVGVATRGRTGYFDPDDAAARRKLVVGLAVSRMSRRFGLEAEVARVSGFLTGSGNAAIIESSSIHTVTGNLIVRLPRVGPVHTYAAAGVGAVHISSRDIAGLFPVSEWQPVFDVGAGISTSAGRRLSFGADARYFRSRRGDGSSSSIGFGETFVDFVRLTARVTISLQKH